MLKTLLVPREQKGFILPFVLFTAAIVMVTVISGIHIYKNNIQLTHHHIQQIKIETLFQSGLAHFKQDMENGDITLSKSSDDTLTTTYTLPDGDVEIYNRLVEDEETEDTDTHKNLYRLRCIITTGDLSYTFIHFVTQPEAKK